MTDPWFIRKAIDLSIGEVLRSETHNYAIHRYRDGWHILWDTPIATHDLGRFLAFPSDLCRFLKGEWTVGSIIKPEKIEFGDAAK
jgi:hypothetical protein